MPKPGRSDIVVAVLVVGAIALGALGFAGFTDDTANSLLFAAWTLALLALFMLALRLPLRGSGSRLSAWLTTALVAAAAIAIVIAANVALFRHDVHFDVSREGRNTPPAQLTTVVSNLHAPLSMTYFYNAGDPNALAAKELITIAAHGHPLFAFRAIDLDKEPGLARDVGVRAYNTAVLQAGGRKVSGREHDRRDAHGLRRHARAQGAGRDRLLHHRPWRAVPSDAGAFSLQPRRDSARPRPARRRRRAGGRA